MSVCLLLLHLLCDYQINASYIFPRRTQWGPILQRFSHHYSNIAVSHRAWRLPNMTDYFNKSAHILLHVDSYIASHELLCRDESEITPHILFSSFSSTTYSKAASNFTHTQISLVNFWKCALFKFVSLYLKQMTRIFFISGTTCTLYGS